MHLQLLFILVFGCLLIFAGLFNHTLKTAQCLLNYTQQDPLSYCQKPDNDYYCSEKEFLNTTFLQINDVENSVQPVCKNLNGMVLSWNNTPSANFLEIYSEISQENHIYTKPTPCNEWEIQELKPNSTYKIRLWRTWGTNDTAYYLESSVPYQVNLTVPFSDLAVPNFEVKNVTVTENEGFDAFVTWEPAKGMPCCYRVDAFGVDIAKHVPGFVCNRHFPPYEKAIRGLTYGYTYNITIRGISRGERSFVEGPASFITVQAPSCEELHSDLSVCTPSQPEDLVVLHTCDETLICDVNISWSTPNLPPDSYIVSISKFEKSFKYPVAHVTVPGTVNSTVVDGLPSGTYDVSVAAVSKARSSTAAVMKDVLIAPVSLSDGGVNRHLAIIIAIFVIIVILVSLFIYLFIRKAKSFGTDVNKLHSEKRLQYESIIKPSSEIIQKDEWEIHPDNITFEGILGEGAFGLVKKGFLKTTDGQSVEVAVKMLKPHWSSEEARQLHQEIAIMKLVGSHPNLVSMIGCVTGGLEGPFLLVEYCPHGDLQGYLRKEWEKFNAFYRTFKQTISDESNNVYNVFNKSYAFNNGHNVLTVTDLLSFARQITLGMEHLTKMKVLHRDLAARNVLVLDNKLVKVSDFGLSRDVYQNNVYLKEGNGKLPIRWMALESITHQMYTTQSDVWSFGVLLWEIATLGEHPYPEVGNTGLVQFIKSGRRMQKPPNCEDALYQIMLSCWKENPKERPTFTELRTKLEALMEDSLHYVKL